MTVVATSFHGGNVWAQLAPGDIESHSQMSELEFVRITPAREGAFSLLRDAQMEVKRGADYPVT
jgi:hypothetical protein